MSALDYNYVADLVSRSQTGDSDAFAELYAATYQRQYHFAFCYLNDEYLAQDALQETYILALKNIMKLKDPSLVIAWLNQINFRVCYNLQKKQHRYNLEMDDYNDQIFSSAETNGLQPESRGHGRGDRFKGIYHESDLKASFYRSAGHYPEILSEYEAR